MKFSLLVFMFLTASSAHAKTVTIHGYDEATMAIESDAKDVRFVADSAVLSSYLRSVDPATRKSRKEERKSMSDEEQETRKSHNILSLGVAVDASVIGDESFPFSKPYVRYLPWSELSVEQKTAAGSLTYTVESWNNLGTAGVEETRFISLKAGEKEGAKALGLDTNTWDCFMNHYENYDWDSFHADVKAAVETLGYSERSWSEDTEVASEGKKWADLTSVEQSAATRLCFFEEVWDGTNILSLGAVV